MNRLHQLIKQLCFQAILLVINIPTYSFGQDLEFNQRVARKYISIDLSKAQNLQDIVTGINSLTTDKREKLQMLLLWSYQNMNVDSNRFFNGGIPLTRNQAIKSRIGLCDEFSNIVNDFCKSVEIPTIRVAGYVKTNSFQPGDKFRESNHAWNAVLLDSTWMLCDLFWSIAELKESPTTTAHFEKKLTIKYFLASPTVFAKDHLPSDPIFQFENYPVEIEAFTNAREGIDATIEKLPFLNYNDSISKLMKLDIRNRQVRIAEHAYAYNKYNPNDLIAEYFNYSVDVLNSKAPMKSELKKAKKYLTAALSLIEISSKVEIKELRESCKAGLTRVDKKLSMLN
jgi:hypothetical protein